MAEHIITASAVSFAPATVLEEVLQNVRAILATRRGTVPLDRAFGVSWDFVDDPLPVAKARFLAEAVRAVETYEPRARVLGVTWGDDAGAVMDGVLRPIVRVFVDDSLAAESLYADAAAASNAEAGPVSGGSASDADSARISALSYRIAAAESRLDRLHELEVTDYEDIYDNGL